LKRIGNLVHANFAGHFFDIPLKGTSSLPGAYTNQELYDALAHLFGYVFLDLDTAKSFKSRVVGVRDVKRMSTLMQAAVTEAKSQHFTTIKHILGFKQPLLTEYGDSLVRRLSGFGKGVDEVVWTVIPTAAAACATQAQGVSRIDEDEMMAVLILSVGPTDRSLPLGQILPPLARDPRSCPLRQARGF